MYYMQTKEGILKAKTLIDNIEKLINEINFYNKKLE